MTIEINRNSAYTHRINPDDPRQIDKRENKHGARWQPYKVYRNGKYARDALWALERDRNGRASTVVETIRDAPGMDSMQQKELAQQLGISQQYLSKILSGTMTVTTYVAIGLERVLGLNAEDLLVAQAKEELKRARGQE